MRFRLALPALTIVLLTVAARPAAAQEKDRTTVRIFDVSALVTPVGDAVLEAFGPSLPPGFDGPDFGDDREPRTPYPAEDLVELLKNCGDGSSWDQDDVVIQVVASGRLLIRQTPEILDRIAAQLLWLDRSLRRRVDLDVHWLTFGARSVERLRSSGLLAALDRGSLDARETGQILVEAMQPGNEHESGSASSTLGRRVAIRRTTFVTYLQDYQVEIAQAAQIGDPIVAVDKEGLEVYVRPRPLLDGNRVELDVLARAGRFQTPMPVIQTEATELGTLDMPRFETVNLSTSGILGNGRTMAAVVRSPLGDRPPRLAVLLVKPRVSAVPSKRPDGLPTFFDCGFMTSPPQQFIIGWTSDTEERRGVAPGLYPIEDDSSRVGLDELVDAVRESIDPDSWDEEGAWLHSRMSRSLLVRNGAQITSRTRRFLESVEADAAQSLRVDARIFSVPAETLLDAGPVVAAGPRPDQSVIGRVSKLDGARELRGITLNALTGAWACGQAGILRNYILDYDAEVAQEARISDPIIGQIFDGLLVSVRPVLSLDGEEVKMRVLLRFAHVDEGSVVDPRRTGSAMNGVLHHPREKAVRINGTFTFPRGGCRIIDGGADLAEEGRRLLIVLGARW